MEKNNPSNPLWTPCKSSSIPRLSRSSESNLGVSLRGEYFMAECHIHNTPSPHRARHCGLVVYMAFSHEVTCQPGSEEQHKIFFSGCRPRFSRLARSFAARRSTLARACTLRKKRDCSQSRRIYERSRWYNVKRRL